MPDTPPTVIESDRILARKWYRCGCGATYETIMESEPAARQRHHHHVADEVESVASQIAAAREAWGAPRGEVAALVEAAERVANCAKHPAVANLWVIVDAQMHPNIQGGVSALTTAIVLLRAALGRVKGVGA